MAFQAGASPRIRPIVRTDLLARPVATRRTDETGETVTHLPPQVGRVQAEPGRREDGRRTAHNPAIYRARSMPDRAGAWGPPRLLADSVTLGQRVSEPVGVLHEMNSRSLMQACALALACMSAGGAGRSLSLPSWAAWLVACLGVTCMHFLGIGADEFDQEAIAALIGLDDSVDLGFPLAGVERVACRQGVVIAGSVGGDGRVRLRAGVSRV
jgi:hypothetical protein